MNGPLRSMSHEQLVHECSYRGAELVVERERIAIFKRRLRKLLDAAWTDFLDANPDDLNSPEELPDHALVTFEQMAGMVETALASAIEARSGSAEGESAASEAGDAR